MGAVLLGVIVVLLSLSLRCSYKGIVRRRQERSAGYTTIWKVAKYEPNLVYIDDKDGQVIAAAGDPRPATGRRADLDAAKARWTARTEPLSISHDAASHAEDGYPERDAIS